MPVLGADRLVSAGAATCPPSRPAAFRLSTPRRITPFGQGTAPIEASYPTAVLKNDDPKQSMQLTATGRWKLTFR